MVFLTSHLVGVLFIREAFCPFLNSKSESVSIFLPSIAHQTRWKQSSCFIIFTCSSSFHGKWSKKVVLNFLSNHYMTLQMLQHFFFYSSILTFNMCSKFYSEKNINTCLVLPYLKFLHTLHFVPQFNLD